MLIYALIFAIAFVLSLILTPIAKYLSFRFNILDHPGHRKIHKKATPLAGGLAIIVSFAAAICFAGLAPRELFGILGVGGIFVLFGLLDDAGIKIRATYKICAHLSFSLLFIYLTDISFKLFEPAILNFILSACFITFMTNSMNMLDGMDGLVSGVAFFASLFFFILALSNNSPRLVLITLALAGATMGFLKYNFYPASVFLGEAGSTLIGFLLAVFSLILKIFKLWNIALILYIPRVEFISFIIPLIILGIPIFDTFFVFINRFFNRIKMSTPGKDHSHHRIHLMGLSQRATVLGIYGMQLTLGLIALAMVNADFHQFVSLLLVVGVLAVSVWVFLVKVKVYPTPEKQ